MEPFTHYGWFWFCPIMIAPEHPECPVQARWAWLEPLFSVCELLERAHIGVSSAFFPDYEPTFMFKVTRPINEQASN